MKDYEDPNIELNATMGEFLGPMAPGMDECIPRIARIERDRCIQLVWEHRGKCASDRAALALMDVLNGAT